MNLFAYDFLDLKGKKRKGRIEAPSEKEARETLRRQGVMLLSLEAIKFKSFNTPLFFRQKRDLNKTALTAFTFQLGQLLRAGIPLYEALLSMEEQLRAEKFHFIIQDVCLQVKMGHSLSEAFSKHPKSFSPIYCAMIASGEAVGALDKALIRLADLLTKQARWSKQLTTALLYPCVIAVFSCLIIFLLLIYVIPSLESLFEGRAVNGFTQLVFNISHFFRKSWSLLLLFPLVGGLTLKWQLKKKSAQEKLYKFLQKIPGLGTFLIKMALGRFSRTLGTLLQGGVNLLPALQQARLAANHPLLASILEEAEQKVVEGCLLSHELKKTTLIPPLLVRMIAVGEEGGSLAQMLQQVAEIYEEETERTLVKLLSLAQPIFLLITGCVVGLLMLAVLLPLSDITAFLQD